jgi:hypothetical protein
VFDKKIGELRPSQFISTFGPGAIMDLPDFSVIIAGTDQWDTELCQPPIEEPRLLRKYGLEHILPLPMPEKDTWQGTLPAFRFPKYQVCPECHKIGLPRKDFKVGKDGIIYCSGDPAIEKSRKKNGKHQTDVKTFPSRFIVACNKGHISDFPWHRYAHLETKNFNCNSVLVLQEEGKSGAIADIKIHCVTCNATRSLGDAFNKNIAPKLLGECTGKRPWLGESGEENNCDEPLRTLLRGASNLYFPVIESALMIPPYNNPVHKAVTRNIKRFETTNTIEMLKMGMEAGFFPEFNAFTTEEVWAAIQGQKDLPVGKEHDLLFPEWDAILRGSRGKGEIEFETEEHQVPVEYQKYISKLIMLRRLTEVRIIDGFTRIDPPPDTTALLAAEEGDGIYSRKASLSKYELKWRPGMKTFGEGIFIALNEEAIQEWENKKVNIYEQNLNLTYNQYCDDRKIEKDNRRFPGARYVLLHSLAHALMRQFSLDSGYSSSALRERIYARKVDDGKKNMAGILIYTATPDSEGSLGGLVELGETKRFGQILWDTLQEAKFCSGDPLCSEHRPGTIGDLNGASCHSCTLSPETSCERSNHFLDRALLVPTVSETKLAFFED